MDGGDNFSTRGGRRTPTRPVQHPDPADVIRQEEVEELLQIFLEYCRLAPLVIPYRRL